MFSPSDETFSSFHPEAHLPLSRVRGRSVYVQLSLPDPPQPGLVLLVHSCMAFTQAPHPGWMLVYDGYDLQKQIEFISSILFQMLMFVFSLNSNDV